MKPLEIYARAHALALDFGIVEPMLLSPADITRAYNGVGPARFPAKARGALDRFLETFLPAVMIHDLEFTFGDGTSEHFRAANRRLTENALRCANDAYPWWRPRRYAARAAARLIGKACDIAGFDAYVAATEQRKKEGSLA